MTARIVFTETLRADLRAQTARLLDSGRPDRAARLLDELELAAKLLARSPAAGAVEQRDTVEIRQLLLRQLPFLLRFHHRARDRKVVVLRLFHVRQSRS